MVKCPKCGYEFEIEEKTETSEIKPTEEIIEQAVEEQKSNP